MHVRRRVNKKSNLVNKTLASGGSGKPSEIFIIFAFARKARLYIYLTQVPNRTKKQNSSYHDTLVASENR
jgi:hypothetical protein